MLSSSTPFTETAEENIEMKRREFLQIITGGAVGACLSRTSAMGAAPRSHSSQMGRTSPGVLDLSEIPNFCSHEHWSTTTVGSADGERKQGVTPAGPVDVSCFIRGGHNANTVEECRKYWSQRRRRFGLSGNFQYVRRGIHALHGQDLAQDDPEVWAAASASITKAYEDLHGWTPKAISRVR